MIQSLLQKFEKIVRIIINLDEEVIDIHKKILEDLDLLIISDVNEYVCKNVSCISVIQVMTVERVFKKNENKSLSKLFSYLFIFVCLLYLFVLIINLVSCPIILLRLFIININKIFIFCFFFRMFYTGNA
jgi:hypothetical protein